jgi:hypothetical protein
MFVVKFYTHTISNIEECVICTWNHAYFLNWTWRFFYVKKYVKIKTLKFRNLKNWTQTHPNNIQINLTMLKLGKKVFF